MADPRSSTVFDYTALRVHPDGSRVRAPVHSSSDPSVPSSSAPFSAPSRRAHAVQTLNAQWIARDAGGSGKVPLLMGRRKNASRKAKEAASASAEGQDVGMGVEDDIARAMAAVDGALRFSDEEDVSYEEGQATKKRGKKRKRAPELRPKKRAKFNADLGYLSPPPQPSEPSGTVQPGADAGTWRDGLSQSTVNKSSQLPEPSPDLLKVLHRFASEFYSERGQLLNISREYRRERKRRRQERALRKKGKGKAKATSSSPGAEGRDGEKSSEDEDTADEESDEEEEVEEEVDDEEVEGDIDEDGDDEENEDRDGQKRRTKPKMSSKARGKQKAKSGSNKPRILPPVYTDMYKVFEGSALMVLGMLVQEHIASILTPHKPPGWDEEVGLAYAEHPEETGEADDVNENEEEEEEEEGEEEEEEEEEEESPADGEDGDEEAEQLSGVSLVARGKRKQDHEEDGNSEDVEGEEDLHRQKAQVKPQKDEEEDEDEENDDDDDNDDEDEDEDEDEENSVESNDERSPQTEKLLKSREDSTESSEEGDSDSEEDSDPDEQLQTSQKAPSSSGLRKSQLDEEETDSEDDYETDDDDYDDKVRIDRHPQQDRTQNNQNQKAVGPPQPMEESDSTEEDDEKQEDVAMRSDTTEQSDSEEEYI